MLKKMIAIGLAALLALTLSVPALAENERHSIRVSGNATVSLAADTAAVQIGVSTQKETVREAQAENARLMKAVLDAIYQMGIDEKDVMTSEFNVNTIYDFRDNQDGELRVLYYQVQNNVSVIIHDLSLIGPVLDAAMEAGANTTYGITFSSTQENEAYQKALTRAVEDAVQKANVIAAAANVQLGALVSIDATQDQYSWNRDAYGASNSFLYNAKAADAGTAITGGDISVSASVTMEYEFASQR